MKIYNTLNRKKEEFVPIEANKVKMYACGPTVYNYFHIGNARPFVFFDVVRRYFEFRGMEVVYVQNITDIDDKIINKAIEDKSTFQQIAKKYISAFVEDTAKLGIRQPDYQPKASDVIGEIIKLIKQLEKKGYAYEVDGDVYFSVEMFKDYGKLSGKKIDDQKAGARVEANINKRHPADFTLWKKAKAGEPVWKSPWGEGRPGWHSECVVLSQKYLGSETFDIHGGGVDLVFPHHENENAQAEVLSHKPLANYWMHNGFINIEGEKMSKSLDNFFTARDILKEHDAETIRFFFLSKHYRSPIDFNREIMQESETAVKNFYTALKLIKYDASRAKKEYSESLLSKKEEFITAMDDDFNTAKALSVMFDLVKIIKNPKEELEEREITADLLVELGRVLGFFSDLEGKLSNDLGDFSEKLLKIIINLRNQAKIDKNWALSDMIRVELLKEGIQLLDTKDGTKWEIK
ncbi:cysteine--tRNA ligase [bacterium]|nr:cysteine--tRNA ligase [bacterium]